MEKEEMIGASLDWSECCTSLGAARFDLNRSTVLSEPVNPFVTTSSELKPKKFGGNSFSEIAN